MLNFENPRLSFVLLQMHHCFQGAYSILQEIEWFFDLEKWV